MAKLYIVSLSDAGRLFLQRTIKKGKGSARTTTRARILLKADEGPEGPEWTDTKIAEAVEVSQSTVERLRKRAVTEGVEAALQDRPKWENRHGKLDGEQEARLTALACGQPPPGRTRWTLHLLADTFSEKEDISVFYELVRRTLKKQAVPPPQAAVVHPTRAERRVRLAYGGRARCLHSTLRSAMPPGLLR